MFEVLKNDLGWAGYSKQGYIHRKYAVRFDGQLLRTKSGAIRTFGSRESANKAGGDVLASEMEKCNVQKA